MDEMRINPDRLVQAAEDAQARRAQLWAEIEASEARDAAYLARRPAEVRAQTEAALLKSLPGIVESALNEAASRGSTSASVLVGSYEIDNSRYGRDKHAGALAAANTIAYQLNAIPGLTAEVTDTRVTRTKSFQSGGGPGGMSTGTTHSYKETEDDVKINVHVRRP